MRPGGAFVHQSGTCGPVSNPFIQQVQALLLAIHDFLLDSLDSYGSVLFLPDLELLQRLPRDPIVGPNGLWVKQVMQLLVIQLNERTLDSELSQSLVLLPSL